MPRALVLGLCLLVAAAGIGLVLREGDGPAADGVALPLAAESHGSADPATTAPRSVGPRVLVEWTNVRRVAAAAADVRVERAGEAVAARVETIAIAPLRTGDAASARGVVVRVLEGGREHCRRPVVHADGAMQIDLGPERELAGRVVDATGRGVAGAVVWCGGALESTSATDADGRFVATVAAGRGVPVVVRADGMATKGRFVDVDPVHGARADFVIANSAPLRLQAAGTVEALRDARVVLLPPALPSTEIVDFPFWAQDLFADLRFDAEGRVAADGLPEGSTIAVACFGPALVRGAPLEIVVRAAAEPTVVAATDGPRVRGVVVDERGEPVDDAEVVALPGSARSEEAILLPVAVPPRAASAGRSGADGSFDVAIASRREEFAVLVRAGGVAAEQTGAKGEVSALRLVLPRSLQGRARCEIPPPIPGLAWSIRVDPWTDDRFVEVAADTPFAHDVPSSFVGDVRVRVADGEAWSAPRERKDVVVDGAFALPSELLQ